ncbi:hypothetical protein GCM10028818_61960 [Spirosoma horti]
MLTDRIKPLLVASFLALVFATVGLSQNLPNKQRDSLLFALKRSQPDTNRINIYLNLGQYYIDKPFDLQSDADSAMVYIRLAEKLNNSLGSKGNKVTAHHIRVLLKVGAFYLFKPLELKSDMDTAMLYAKQAEQLSLIHQPSLLANSLELLGNLFWETHDTLQGKNYFYKAIRQYEQLQDTARLAAIWFAFGEHYPHSKKVLTQKINCYRHAFTYFHQLKNQFREQEVLDYIDYTYFLQGRNEENYAGMLNVLQQYKAENYALLDYIYYRLSIIEVYRGNYHGAMQYSLKAIQQALSTNQTQRLGDYYNQISNIYQYLNNIDKQLEYARMALYFFEKYNRKAEIHAQAGQICFLLIRKKKAAEAFSFYQNILRQFPITEKSLQILSLRNLALIYEALEKYKKAELYYLQFLSRLEGYNNQDPVKVGAYLFVGMYYLNRRDFTKARYYFTQHAKLINPLENPKAKQTNQLYFFKLDSAQGNFQSALAHFQQYSIIKDSIQTAKKAKQIEELQIQYETTNKEQRINLLTTQARVQQARIQQANLTRNVSFGGAAMLLILLGLIYNRYRLKQSQQVQIQLKNQALEELVSEKEWLLKEIHHRVKNNLQLIISLLQSQGRYLLDKAAISAIEQSEHRVRAMALIHQKLYRAENLAQIDMPAYIQEVAGQLSDSFDPQKRIALQYTIAPLKLDVSQAVPLGLIINEAITNAFKYAFPGNRTGIIQLSVTKIDSEHYRLSIDDNGVGLPKDFDLSRNKSMGANIMRRLSKQLGGAMEVQSLQGVEISIVFTLFHPQPSVSYAA